MRQQKKFYIKDAKTGIIKEMKLRNKIVPQIKTKRLNESKEKQQEPRTWSSKFWKTNSIADVLNEIVEPDSIEVDELAMKEELYPEVWKDDKLIDEVRNTLLKNAVEFIKFCKIDKLSFKDVILTGSLANYNYTEHSDLDVHILLDFNKISCDKEFVSEYFRTKKSLWSEKHGTEVKGHDVELYVQDTSEPHTATGVYSLVKNSWLTKPINKMIAIDTANVQLKSAAIMNTIDEMLDSENADDVVEKIDAVMNKLKKMRSAGLEKEGEFSTENLVFKILRNAGYLNKLNDVKQQVLQKELTLEGLDVTGSINEANLRQVVNKAKRVGLLTLGMVVGLIAADISTQHLRDAGVPQDLLHKAEQFVKNAGQDFLGIGNVNTNTQLNQTNQNVIK